jgi:hypothetical protein
VTVTITRDQAVRPIQLDFKYPRDSPNCSIGRAFCDKLFLAGVDYVASSRTNKIIPPPFRACPVRPFCKLSLHEVVIIYWPDNVVSRDICGNDGYGSSEVLAHIPTLSEPIVVTTTAITFRGQDLYIRSINGTAVYTYLTKAQEYVEMENFVQMVNGSVLEPYILPSTMRGSWTFTYPTVYLAHREITANMVQSFSTGSPSVSSLYIRSAGIIPVDREDISSVRWVIHHNYTAQGGLQTARLVAKGLFRPTVEYYVNGKFETRSFDFGHLADPVPASVYYDAHAQDC